MAGERFTDIVITRPQQGGFIVLSDGDPRKGQAQHPIFACGDIDVLIGFVRMHFEVSGGDVMRHPQCTIVLREQGKVYPRTCAECGLGPCKLGKREAA
jgi:hypothetical protein